MQYVALPAASGKMVFPADALGYSTEDGHRVLAWDYENSEFYLDNGSVCTHGEIGFNSFLVPPREPNKVPPIGRYVTCAMLGDCRVDAVSNTGVLVRSATRSVAVLAETLQTLVGTSATEVGMLYMLLPDNSAYVLKGVNVSGGAMGLVDHVMDRLKGMCGVTISGDALMYERVKPDGVLCALRHVRSCNSLVLEVRGEVDSGAEPAAAPAAEGIIRTSCTRALTHCMAMDFLDMNPWVLPCTMNDLWHRLGYCTSAAPPNSEMVRAPWVVHEHGLVLDSAMPTCARGTFTVPADVLVQGIRSGRVTARAGGKYTTAYDNGDDGEVICPTDMHELAEDLEELVNMCIVVGPHHVREMLPACPDALFMERLGAAYDAETGIYTSA